MMDDKQFIKHVRVLKFHGSEPSSQPGSEPSSEPGSSPGKVVRSSVPFHGDLMELHAGSIPFRSIKVPWNAPLQKWS
jgi:hypothetical protein